MNMQNKLLSITIAALIILGISCSKTSLTEETGTLKDFTGLDGCGMMIVLDSGKRLEMISLPANTTLIADRRVAVKYKAVPHISICMAGTTAEIKSLRYL